MKLCWRTSRSASIVVLDGSRETTETLERLFSGRDYVAIESNDLFSIVTPLLFLKLVWYFLRIKSLKAAYVAALLSVIQPRIVVTFIDNSLLFQRVARILDGSMRFLAIQNGMRMLARDNPSGSPTIFHSEFACFGEHDIFEYRKHGAEVKCFYPIGSLKDAYFRASHPEPPKQKLFDLCLISQIKPQHYQVYPKTMESLELLTKHLKRFCENHGTTLCVASRRHPDGKAEIFQWETEWFREHLGYHAEIIANDIKNFTSYSLVDASRVSLALHTSMLHEGFGRGNRILACNYTGDDRYDFPIPGIWCLTDPTYEAFESRLMNILQMSDLEYSERTGIWPTYLISYQRECPTHDFLQRLIADAADGVPLFFDDTKYSGVISPEISGIQK